MYLDEIFGALTAVLAVATALPLSRHDAWWVRDWEFPRLQLATLALVLLLLELLLLDRSKVSTWLLAFITLACLVYQFWWILPYTPLFRAQVPLRKDAPQEDSLCIICSNVLMSNRNADALVRIVRREHPDVLIALETDEWWQERLDVLRDEYPHLIACPLDNRYGMHVYSRLPLEDARVQFLVERNVPSAHAAVVLRSGRRVFLHCLHPTPPSPTENPESGERDAELIMVGKSVADCPDAVVVAGDLNDVAWSSTTRLFRKLSGLLDPRIGRGMYNSFNANWTLLRWPLDHLFHSRHFALVHIERLEHVGSDHFPILVRLMLCPGSNGGQDGPTTDEDEQEEAEQKMEAEQVSPEEVHQPKRAAALVTLPSR